MLVFEKRDNLLEQLLENGKKTQRQIKLDPKYGIRIRTQAQLILKRQFIE